MNSIQELVENVKENMENHVISFSGRNKRILLGMLSKAFGRGGQSYLAQTFGVSRTTIRKGERESSQKKPIMDRFDLRGRKKVTEFLSQLEEQICRIADAQSQIDPKFQSDRIYTNLTAGEVKKQLVKSGCFQVEDLPTERTIRTILNRLGYTMRKIRKTKPLKKLEVTDAIFENIELEHKKAEADPDAVPISIDTKNKVSIGNFSRGGRGRTKLVAADHDFGTEYLIPFGILDRKEQDVTFYVSDGKITADFIVDQIEDFYIRKGYDKTKRILYIDADNGPENSSIRTQYIKRMVQFSIEYNVEIHMVYDPPYYSKYNAIERIWGFLEKHWSSGLLDTKESVINYMKSFRYQQKASTIQLVKESYETGIKTEGEERNRYESVLERKEGLEKYAVVIHPERCMETLCFYELYG